MPTIKLLKRAELEVIDACEWYEKQQVGLSAKFRKQLRFSLQFIDLDPKLYAKRYDTDLRFTPLNKFPYVIVFWYDDNLNTVFITSVFHTKRKPDGFKS